MTNIGVSVPEEDLAVRCEQATGPNFQLEYDIAEVVFGGKIHIPKNYTASLDAAMTLVPEGCHGQVQFGNRPGAWVGKEGTDADDFNVAATPALALCAAALRARVKGHSS